MVIGNYWQTVQITHLDINLIGKCDLYTYLLYVKLSFEVHIATLPIFPFGMEKSTNIPFQTYIENKAPSPCYFILIALNTCDISVIIPTLNEEKYIHKCLRSLKSQEFEGSYEVIVVDGGSQDRTMEIVKSLVDKAILFVDMPVGAARNLGAKLANGKAVAFLDADTIASKQWLESIQEAFDSSTKLVGVTGPTLPCEGGRVDHLAYKVATGWIQKLSISMGIPHIAGFNCAYLKEPFLKCGGYDENKRLSEDLTLSLRIRHVGRIAFNKDMLAYTSIRRIRHYGYPYLLTYYLINDMLFFIADRTLSYRPIR